MIRSALIALVVLAGFSAQAAEVYFGRLTAQSGGTNSQLIIVGTQPGTTSYTYQPLPTGTAISGTVTQYQRVVVVTNATATGINFRLDTSVPLLATAGMDCCDFSGNVFFPTIDGKRFYGTSHIIAPGFIGAVGNRISVFARLAGTVTITNRTNSAVVTNTMVANSVWVPNFDAGGLGFTTGDVLTVTTTGEVAIGQVVGNGYTTVPPVPTGSGSPEDCDNDSGRTFLFGTHNWQTGSFAVMNSSATAVAFTLRTVNALGLGAAVTNLSVPANSIYFQSGMGTASYQVAVTTAAANVDVWAGDNEGAASVNTMGDDLSLNLGAAGLHFLLRSSSVGTEPGLVLFSREANTTVTATPRPASATCVAFTTTLGVNGILNDLAPNALTKGCTWDIVASKPVTVWSFGGNSLNDSASTLRPAMGFDTDGNGVPDTTEAGTCSAVGIAPDFDADGVPDYQDLDDDDDCVLDTAEPVGGRLNAALPATAHCSGATPFCDTTVHTAGGVVSCRACAANTECALATPVCVTGGGAPFQGQCIATPDTTITASPPLNTNSTAATFNFSGTPAGSTFECSLDGAAFSPCTGPFGFSVAPGSHTFSVRSVAGNQRDATPATYAWNVDLVAPVAPVVTAPANGARTNQTSPTYSGTAEAGSTVVVRVDGNIACTVTATAGGTFTCTPALVLTPGAHTVNATATDAAGNTSPASTTNTFTVDTTPPAAAVVTAPANGSRTNQTSPTYTGTAEANATVIVRVDGNIVCSVTASAAGAWTCTPAVVLTPGSHAVTAQATDQAGNTGPVGTANTFTVDTTPPPAPVVTAPANGSSTNDTTPTYAGTAEANATVTVTVDGAVACIATASAAGAWACTPAIAIAAGSHTVSAAATDQAGNGGPASAVNTFTIDLTAPPAPVVTAPANGTITNDTTPTYSGTAEANSTVTVTVDGVTACAATASATGAWACTPAIAIAAGSHTVNAIARDAANNASPVSNTNTFTIDATPPAAPVVTAPANGGRTNDTTPTYSGTAEANSTVTVTVDGATACTATASATGAWTCTPAVAIAEGAHTVSAIARDAANNASPASTTNTFTVDTTAPAAPVVTAPANASTTGSTLPVYGGTAEAGSTVTVRVDGNVACTTVATAGGTYSCTQGTALADGPHAVNATATDVAGNVSAVSNTNNFTVDTGAPAAPVVTAPASGASTNDPTPDFSGTAEAGSTVTVRVDGNVVCTAVATAGGTWTCTPTVALAEGPHQVSATATDTSNNVSPPSANQPFTIDTAAPDTTIVSGPPATDPSATAVFDFSSTEAGSTFECSLDGAAFAPCSDPATFGSLTAGMHTLQVRAKDAAGNVDATPASQTWTVLPQLDTTIVSGPPALTNVAAAPFDFSSNTANVTYECSLDGAAFAPCTDPVTLMGLPDGMHSLRVRAKDNAGNFDTTPAIHLWTLDTTAPAAPAITSPTANATVGVNPPVITGTGEPGSTVTVLIDGIVSGTVVVDPSGTWTFVPSMPLTMGIHTVAASAKDPAGNTGPTSVPVPFTIDSNALDTAIVSGPSGLVTSKNATFDFSSNRANATYECSLDGAAYAPCTDPVTFSNLAEGPHTLLVRAKDGATTDASPASRLWTVDSVAPAAPLVTAPANNSTIGTGTPTITGSAEPGSTVTVVIDGIVAGTALTDASGKWTFVPTTALGNGPHTVLARAKDPAGNTGPDSPVNTFTVDPTVLDTFIVSGPMSLSRFNSAAFDLDSNQPNVTYECSIDGGAFMPCSDPATFTGLTDGSHTVQIRAKGAGGAVDTTPATFTWTVDTMAPGNTAVVTPANGAMLTDSRPTVTGTAEPGATVTVSIDGVGVGTAIADAMGKWSLPLSTALADGSHTVNATATDPAGNKGSPSMTNTFTISTGKLTTPTITTPAPGSTTNDPTPTLTGKAPPNSTVSVFVDGVLVGTAIADANGDWTFTLPAQTDGSKSITVKAGKGAQTSDTSAPVVVTIDTMAPDVTIVSQPPAQNTATTSDFTFSSLDATATFECSLDGATFAACPKDYSPTVAVGDHTLAVRAVDAAGNRSAARSATWTQADNTVTPDQQLVGGGCACSAVDPIGFFAMIALLAVARRRRR